MNILHTIDKILLQLASKAMNLADFFHLNRKLFILGCLWISLAVHFLLIKGEPFCVVCHIIPPFICASYTPVFWLDMAEIDKAQESREALLASSFLLGIQPRLIALVLTLISIFIKAPPVLVLGFMFAIYLLANYPQPPGKRLKDMIKTWSSNRKLQLRPIVQT